jgi:hypothetical protein
VGQLGADQPAADAQGGEVRLVAEALDELGGGAERADRVQRTGQDGLGV